MCVYVGRSVISLKPGVSATYVFAYASTICLSACVSEFICVTTTAPAARVAKDRSLRHTRNVRAVCLQYTFFSVPIRTQARHTVHRSWLIVDYFMCSFLILSMYSDTCIHMQLPKHAQMGALRITRRRRRLQHLVAKRHERIIIISRLPTATGSSPLLKCAQLHTFAEHNVWHDQSRV